MVADFQDVDANVTSVTWVTLQQEYAAGIIQLRESKRCGKVQALVQAVAARHGIARAWIESPEGEMEVSIPAAKIPPKSRFRPTMSVQRIVGGDADAELDAILLTIRALERQVLRLRKRPRETAAPEPEQPRRREFNPRFGKPDRPPIKLSLLRTGTVSELFARGVFFPEFDLDDTFDGELPDRPRQFGGADFIPGYDLEGEGDATRLGKVQGRGRVTLSALRTASISVLYALRVFFPDYDEDDLFVGVVPERPRDDRSRLMARFGMNPEWQTRWIEAAGRYVVGYDYDDIEAPGRALQIQSFADAMVDELRTRHVAEARAA